MEELQTKWRRARSKLRNELGRTATHEEVAKSLNIPAKILARLKKGMIRSFNLVQNTSQTELNLPTDEIVIDGNHNSLEEIAIDSASGSPDNEMIEAEDHKRVRELIEKMDPREATVVRMRFGLDNAQPKTLKEIGEHFGLTRERVRQLESEALKNLYERMETDLSRFRSQRRWTSGPCGAGTP